jgi:hypothetical protein
MTSTTPGRSSGSHTTRPALSTRSVTGYLGGASLTRPFPIASVLPLPLATGLGLQTRTHGYGE